MWDEPFRDTDEGSEKPYILYDPKFLVPYGAMAMAEAGPTFPIGGSEPCQSTSRQQVFERQKANILAIR